MVHPRATEEVTIAVGAVGTTICIAFGFATLMDVLFGTAFWPGDAGYGLALLALIPVFVLLVQNSGERGTTVAAICLTIAATVLVIASQLQDEVLLKLAAVTVVAIGVAFGIYSAR